MSRAERRRLGRENNAKSRKMLSGQVKISPEVQPLLDAMVDGQEYASIVSVMPPQGVNLVDYLKQAISDIQSVRGRPCISYIGNVVNGKADSGLITKDD